MDNTHDKSLEHIQNTIRQTFLGKGLPPFVTAAMQDSQINSNPRKIVLVITNSDDNGGLPDPRQLEKLRQLNNSYQKLIVIYSLSSSQQEPENRIKPVRPTDQPETEIEAFTSERAARIYLNEKFH